MIKLINVFKSYGKQSVLEDFSLEIKEGERVALMGRSGAGKTTVINLILGLIKPTSGKVVINGISQFGAVFQENRLIDALSARANVRVASKEEIDSGELDYVFKELMLDDEITEKPVKELSGGEKRRVAIARALLSQCDAYVFDEPLKGIDEITLKSVTELINNKTKGKTFILITHSEEEANALCDRIIRI
ncbi:MAG: ABC transporter ATP-binding protein [Oscillospiraceae bacterium]|nr:ABC transporter ATP-binding protein [Oscillospiraceae bacterium]